MNLERNLPFKGGRTYLHSTTVFDDLLQLKGGVAGGLDFKFDRRTDRQVRYQSERPANAATIVASWSDASGTTYVVERDAPITQTAAYDEDGLASGFDIGERQVAIPSQVGGHSLIEAIVAGYKALLKQTVAGSDAKLAFVRLRLSEWPTLPLDIHFTRRIGEFYQGDIRCGGRSVGQIFFGEWR
jgi:hypothetical protein